MNLDQLAQALFIGGGNTGQPTGGAMGTLMGNPTFNLGMGIMQAAAPNPSRPTTFGSALSGGQALAMDRQATALQNDVRRQAVIQAKRETQGMTDFAAWMQDNPDATPDQKLNAAFQYIPDKAVSAMVSQYADPTLPMRKELAGLQVEEARRKAKEASATEKTQTQGIFASVDSIAGASERLANQGSFFQPGGLVERFGGLEPAAGGLATALAVHPNNKYLQQAYLNVNDALTIHKMTADLALSIQRSPDTGRSATVSNAIQTALGKAMPWPAKRRVLVEQLNKLINDIDNRGVKADYPDYSTYVGLRDKLKAQDEAFTKGSGGEGGGAGAVTAVNPTKVGKSVGQNTAGSVPRPTGQVTSKQYGTLDQYATEADARAAVKRTGKPAVFGNSMVLP